MKTLQKGEKETLFKSIYKRKNGKGIEEKNKVEVRCQRNKQGNIGREI